ncbi:hypothetical protein T265_09612 [Opisthorchis viverrini]|uniref:Uncharacterized protein n=1 Tax=Opisthorchis viverrini TaxID=6198 RepID=A0A074Z562_OPIVI|nr:hypothetical protein T265_09612 [Opisthorchis viverrini]KER22246.1 hypothetical protein T265_09612 [Opisthorchis viverrini]
MTTSSTQSIRQKLHKTSRKVEEQPSIDAFIKRVRSLVFIAYAPSGSSEAFHSVAYVLRLVNSRTSSGVANIGPERIYSGKSAQATGYSNRFYKYSPGCGEDGHESGFGAPRGLQNGCRLWLDRLCTWITNKNIKKQRGDG